jgi:hypothetical protein
MHISQLCVSRAHSGGRVSQHTSAGRMVVCETTELYSCMLTSPSESEALPVVTPWCAPRQRVGLRTRMGMPPGSLAQSTLLKRRLRPNHYTNGRERPLVKWLLTSMVTIRTIHTTQSLCSHYSATIQSPFSHLSVTVHTIQSLRLYVTVAIHTTHARATACVEDMSLLSRCLLANARSSS